MKKVLIALALFVSIASYATPPEINEKVLKAFKETFTNAKEVSWDEFDDYYAVKFRDTEIDTRVKYDKEGNIIQTTRYYFEQQLPPFIYAKIKKRYTDKKIFGVTEVRSETELTYYIVLEDEKNWTTIKSDAFGSFQLHEKFKKA